MGVYKVEIEKITWLCKEIKEADIVFRHNGKHYQAFSHPADFTEGETCNIELSHLDETIAANAILSGNPNHEKKIVQRQNNPWSYEIFGQIVSSRNQAEVDCGDFTFILKNTNSLGIKNGQYIFFVISRLDIGKVS